MTRKGFLGGVNKHLNKYKYLLICFLTSKLTREPLVCMFYWKNENELTLWQMQHMICAEFSYVKNSWKWLKIVPKIFGTGANIFGIEMEYFPFHKSEKNLYEKRLFRCFCLGQISWSNIYLFLLLFSFLLFFLLWNGDRIFMSYERLDCLGR